MLASEIEPQSKLHDTRIAGRRDLTEGAASG